MKYSLGVILLVAGWLGVFIASPLVIFMAMMSTFGPPRGQSLLTFLAVLIPVLAIVSLLSGGAIIRNVRRAIESKQDNG